MGSYTFRWEHPAEDVYVTGTFDNWSKSIKLDKKGDAFEKTVDFKDDANKIYYKYVVDNNWTISASSPKEADHEGNVNNFLSPADLRAAHSPAGPAPGAAIINTVTPQSTTAKMAGEQPLEKGEAVPTPDDIPGGFPVTPANELDKPIGIDPLPAADGALNPTQLAPGEPVPRDIKTQDISQHVKLDKDSYEKSDALAGVDMNLPPASQTKIPEAGFATTSEKSQGNAFPAIATVGTGATTAALAGSVSKEPKQAEVPKVVKDSQDEANAAPEASGQPQEVASKVKVEDELKSKVPEAAVTAQGTSGYGTEKDSNTGGIAATAAAAGGAMTAAAIAAKDTISDKAGSAAQQATDLANKNVPDSVKENLPAVAQNALNSQSKLETREVVAPEIPEEVKQSIIEANKDPEAAANTSAVEDKKAMEQELKKEVEPVAAIGESEGHDVGQEGTEPVDTKANGGAAGASVTGSAAKPSDVPASTTTASPADKKKKNRLSTMLSKIKHKLAD